MSCLNKLKIKSVCVYVCICGVYTHACHGTYVERREQFTPLIMWGAGIKLKIVRLTICLYPPSHFISPCSALPYSSWGQIHVLKHHTKRQLANHLASAFDPSSTVIATAFSNTCPFIFVVPDEWYTL